MRHLPDCVVKGTKINPENYAKTQKFLEERVNRVSRDKSRCLFTVTTPVQRYRASELMWCHTLPAAKVWHRLASGCLLLSRNI